MRKKCVWVALATAFLALALTPSRGAVIFSNIVTTNLGQANVLGSGVPVNGPQSIAAEFTATVNSTMNEAQVKAQGAGGSPFFNLFLYSSIAGAPGSSLETLGTDLAPIVFPTPPAVLPVIGFAPIALTAGTQYWLVMTPFASNSQIGWTSGGSPVAQTDTSPTSDGTAPWSPNADFSVQFEVDGTPAAATPEPQMAGLMAVGLGLGALLVLRRRQFRIGR